MKWSVVLSGGVNKISGPLWFRDFFFRVAEMKTPSFSLGGIRMGQDTLDVGGYSHTELVWAH